MRNTITSIFIAMITLYGQNLFSTSTTENLFSGGLTPFERESIKRHIIVDSITDGDTIGNSRIVGVDSTESVWLEANKAKAQKLADEYDFSLEDQARIGRMATEELKRQLLNVDLIPFEHIGYDDNGRGLIHSSQINERLIKSGLYVPTNKNDIRLQTLYENTRKTSGLSEHDKELIEQLRQYHIDLQTPSLWKRINFLYVSIIALIIAAFVVVKNFGRISNRLATSRSITLCANCNSPISDNTKFCPTCGTQITADATNTDSTEPINDKKAAQLWDKTVSWAIFPAVWVVFHVVFVNGYVSINNIAEALGGALVVLMIPLIITAIISAIKSFSGQRYTNFVKHTFIGTGIMLVLAILSVFNV